MKMQFKKIDCFQEVMINNRMICVVARSLVSVDNSCMLAAGWNSSGRTDIKKKRRKAVDRREQAQI